MATQKIILTALPQGRVSSGLSLWVHVSPQLTGAPSLAGFPEWLVWPEFLAKAQFKVTIDGAAPVTVSAKVDSGALAAWKALFKPSIKVDGYTFPDYTTRFIHSFPVASVLNTVKDLYQQVGIASPEVAPPATSMLPLIGTLIPPRVAPKEYSRISGPRFPDNPKEAIAVVKQFSKGDNITAVGAPGRTVPTTVPGLSPIQQKQLDLYRTRIFHMAIPAATVPDKQTGQPVAKVPPIKDREFIDSVDFHKLVAMAGDHPLVLRMLGLAFEVTLPPGASIAPGAGVKVEWAGPALPTAPTFVAPKTLLTGPDFLPLPKSAEVRNGFLSMDERFQVVSLDVDSAALKLAQLAEGLGVGERSRTRGGSEPQTAALSALRSAGLSLVRTGRSTKLVGDLDRSKALHTAATGGAPAPLNAEDLIRGWRYDVRTVKADGNPSSGWKSLCERRAQYAISGGPSFQGQDEGWASMAVTEQPGGSGDLYLHESMARWKGWSLCVEPVGKPTADRASDGGTPFGLDSQFLPVPGSLPTLRFGKIYQLRARAADLVGAGVSLKSDESKFVSRPFFYARFEPVPSPFLVLRTPGGKGETPETLVVRSFNDAPAKDTVASGQAAERHAAPPRASAEMCETHGVLDDPSGKPRKDLYALLVDRHEARADLLDRPGRVVAEAEWELPYLPDPLATGLVIHGVPTAAPGGRESLTIEYGNARDWPKPKPIRIRLIEGTRGYRYDTATRVLEIKLPKGDKINLKAATLLTRENLELLQVWRWLAERLTQDPKLSQNLNAYLIRALAGRLWMLTPQKELTIVHAVQQPLKLPTITQIAAFRDVQNAPNLARFEALIGIHGKSTATVDVTGAWEERRDDPSDPANNPLTDRVPQVAPGFRLDLRFPGDEVPEVADAPIMDNANALTALYQPSADRISFVGGVPSLRAARANFPKMAFADTRYRRVQLTARASTRFAEYLYAAEDQPNHPLTRTAPPVAVDVPSGARPLAPRPLYVVPTFGWNRTPGKSVRSGNGLRVYMERPWFSSGDGELLGVVVAGAATLPAGDPRTPYVTQRGRDPIWPGDIPVNVPQASEFGAALKFASMPDTATGPGLIPPAAFPTTGLTLEENPNASVGVAAHAVQYDADRGLWFCDIDLDDRGAYTPFVRLALARYQPRSMNGMHLSRVVLADFAQLLPDRALSVVTVGNMANLTLSGPSPVAGASPLNIVDVVLETSPADGGDMDWAPATDAVRLAGTYSKGRGPGQVYARPTIGDRIKVNPGALALLRPEARWTGSLTLPAPNASRPRRRLTIREYEGFRPDEGATANLRLVYVETMPI